MIKRVMLDMLNQNDVSVVELHSDNDGNIFKRHRRGYSNSTTGRTKVENEVVEPYKSAIFLVWGDDPTVKDNTQ